METLIRLSVALGIFALMVSWEILSPRRDQLPDRKHRWTINLGLAAFNMFIVRVTVGGLAYLSALYAATHGIGLLNLVANTLSPIVGHGYGGYIKCIIRMWLLMPVPLCVFIL